MNLTISGPVGAPSLVLSNALGQRPPCGIRSSRSSSGGER
jgi:hypothetical protein